MKYKMKTTELRGAALDYAVAICEGYAVDYDDWLLLDGVALFSPNEFQPSTKWAQGGAIIEREMITIYPWSWAEWFANAGDDDVSGTSPLEAAMRSYVAAKMGDEVEISAELLRVVVLCRD
jgi:hypothetical protein